ncbi:MAG TPA: hypothetical protein VFD32_12690 [Dehalococcoidia bacterium]|nr:hypothetical protein [Dehalococcoidia bacterium]
MSPDTIFGTLTIDGRNAPAGTMITAMAGAEPCDTQPYNGATYSLTLDPNKGACWQPLAQIRFLVGDRFANESIRPPNLVASRRQVDLTVGAGAANAATSTR